MKQIWLLTKVQLRTAFDFNIISKNKNRRVKKKNSVFVAAVSFFILLLSGVSFLYSYAIGTSLRLIGMLELLPELMMAVTCVITIMTTIYKVKGTLFGFRDYDLVMSLPVNTGSVAASRLLLLYLVNITFTLIIMIPTGIAYGVLAQAAPGFYVISLLTALFIPVVPMIIAAIIGTVITVIASRFRHSNLISLIITFAFLAGIMVFSFTVEDSAEILGEMSAVLTKQVDAIYPLAGMYRRAVCDFHIGSIILFLFISVLAFILFSWIVGLNFKLINTNIAASHTKSNYKIGNLETASPFKALYRKELKRYFSSSLYVMNTAFGVVIMTIGAAATLFMSPKTLAQVMEVPESAQFIGALAPAAVSMCIAMTFITASSISLEGKNLWILKAAPVTARTIFQSKIAVNLTVTLPAIILDGILISIGLKLSLPELLVLMVMPAAYAFFTAISGLIINLNLPKLNWTTEVMVIKQSAAAIAATFGGMIAVAVPIIFLFTLTDVDAVYINGLTTLAIVFISTGMYHYLNTKGEKIFQSL